VVSATGTDDASSLDGSIASVPINVAFGTPVATHCEHNGVEYTGVDMGTKQPPISVEEYEKRCGDIRWMQGGTKPSTEHLVILLFLIRPFDPETDARWAVQGRANTVLPTQTVDHQNKHTLIRISSMIDGGAAVDLISMEYCTRHNLVIRELAHPIYITSFQGSEPERIKYYTDVVFLVKGLDVNDQEVYYQFLAQLNVSSTISSNILLGIGIIRENRVLSYVAERYTTFGVGSRKVRVTHQPVAPLTKRSLTAQSRGLEGDRVVCNMVQVRSMYVKPAPNGEHYLPHLLAHTIDHANAVSVATRTSKRYSRRSRRYVTRKQAAVEQPNLDMLVSTLEQEAVESDITRYTYPDMIALHRLLGYQGIQQLKAAVMHHSGDLKAALVLNTSIRDSVEQSDDSDSDISGITSATGLTNADHAALRDDRTQLGPFAEVIPIADSLLSTISSTVDPHRARRVNTGAVPGTIVVQSVMAA
jgi:hypothetical protein